MIDTPLPALILAGGHARRMGGGDKPLIPLADQTMLARIVAVLGPVSIAISANGDPARFATTLTVLADPIPGQGPLGGVLAGLEWAASLGATALLTVSGDTPLIPTGLAHAMAPAPSVAESDGRVHHLVALWPAAAAASFRNGSVSPAAAACAVSLKHWGCGAWASPETPSSTSTHRKAWLRWRRAC